MNKKRPVNLDLTTISFPPAAIVSILHRASGVLVFLLLPFLLWLLDVSLTAQGFSTLKNDLANPLVKFILWVTLSALIYHLVAGIRHLFMDTLGWGETKESGSTCAYATIISAIVLIILAGVWLW